MNTKKEMLQQIEDINAFFTWCRLFPAVDPEGIPAAVMRGLLCSTSASRAMKGMAEMSEDEEELLIMAFATTMDDCFKAIRILRRVADSGIAPLGAYSIGEKTYLRFGRLDSTGEDE